MATPRDPCQALPWRQQRSASYETGYRPPPARAPDWATSRPIYRPRRPTATPLYPAVQHHLETFLAQASEADPRARFHEATGLTPEHWHELRFVVQRRVLRYFRRHGLLDEADSHGMLSWQGSGGFSIDASVHIEGDDRAGVERLLRYCARPPFALWRRSFA